MITVPITTDDHGLRSPQSFPEGYVRLEIQGDQAVFWMPDDSTPDLPPITPDSPAPDWIGFRRSMLANPDYMAIASQYWQVSRVENAIMAEAPDIAVLTLLWNQLMAAVANPPTTDAIAAWNGLAELYSIPLIFGTDGQIDDQ